MGIVCKECGKEILGKYYECKSLEKEDFDKVFYVHEGCMEKNYERDYQANIKN